MKKLMLKTFRFSYLFSLVLAVVILAGALSAVVAAATSRAFTTAGSLAIGTIVSLDTSHEGSVMAATPNNATKLIGVVVPDASASLQFNEPGAQTQVAARCNHG